MLNDTYKRWTTAVAMALAIGAAPDASAQDKPWPSKPIRFIVPFPPGGPTAQVIRKDLALWGPIVKASGAKVD